MLIINKKINLLILFVLLFYAAAAQTVFAREHEVFSFPVEKSVAAKASFNEFQKRVQHKKDSVMSFEQKKKIKGLIHPIISTGVLTVTKNLISFDTKSPFKSVMTISEKGIMTKLGDEPQRFEVATKMEIRIFIRLMLAVFKSDLDRIRQDFDIYFKADGENFAMGLKPKSKILKHAVQSIILKGKKEVTSIIIREKNGDMTQISLSRGAIHCARNGTVTFPATE